MLAKIHRIVCRDDSFLKLLLAICILFGAGLFLSRIIEIPWQSALRGWDNSFYYMWTRSLMIDGDIDFANEREINNTIAPANIESFAAMEPTKTGLLPNKYGIGWGLSAIPFFLIADGIVWGANLTGLTEIPRDGYGPIYQICQQLGHLCYALIGLYCAYKICLCFFPPLLSKIGILGAWSTSMLPYYQCLNLSMAHNLTFTYTAICYLASLRLLDDTTSYRKRWIALLWFSSGMLVVTRFQAAVYLIFPAYVILKGLIARKDITSTCALFTLALAPVITQLIAWKIIYGSFLINTYAHNEEGFYWSTPALLEVLFSPNHGLFYWHPVLLIGLAGFIVFSKHQKEIGIAWLISLGATYYVNASWWCWWLGSSFGLRNFEASVLFFMVGFSYFLNSIRSRESYWVAAKYGLLVFTLWNINICVLYSADAISRNSAVSWFEMLEATATFYPSILTRVF
ncbi:MAG: hypothetical protein ACPGN3_07190 [Opitutales bacterium]